MGIMTLSGQVQAWGVPAARGRRTYQRENEEESRAAAQAAIRAGTQIQKQSTILCDETWELSRQTFSKFRSVRAGEPLKGGGARLGAFSVAESMGSRKNFATGRKRADRGKAMNFKGHSTIVP